MRYEAARLVPGDGSPPIDDAVLVVEDGIITAVGSRADSSIPSGGARVVLTGKTVIPALVGLHVHLGYQDGLSYAADNYTRATIVDHLNRYAYYGVGTVVSLGTDAGRLAFDIRKEQDQSGGTLTARLRTAGRGLAAPQAGPGSPALRDSAYGVISEVEARRYVAELADVAVDVIKIWVDDRSGRVTKLEPALYRAIIEEAHNRDQRVIAHIFYHADAVQLVEAGVDGFAHLVRDQEMDDVLVTSLVEQGVFIMPNLGVSERRIHAEPPPWLDDPLLHDSVPPEVIARAAVRFEQATEADAQQGRMRYEAMERSVARLVAAGAHVVLGADSGVQDHFPGYAEQRELELMVAAGLTPEQAILAATGRAAEALGFEDVGTLTPGKSADFLVLDADPFEDIVNTRRISQVYLRGEPVDRAALAAGWASR